MDQRCEELFLAARAQEQDDNLLFVRERLLKSGGDLAGLLDLYAQVRRGRRVPDDEMDPFVGVLRLSGIVRPVKGRLQIRNRIYAQVFDQEWVTAHMPGAELRQAFRRGVWRTAAVGAVILTVMGGLVLTAVQQARRADRQRHRAVQQQRIAEAERLVARRNLYAARLNLAQQAEEAGNVGLAQELLEAVRPEPGREDLRGFEWRHLWRRCQGDALATLRDQRGGVIAVAFSPDGKLLASIGWGFGVRLWDVARRQQIAVFKRPDGRRYAAPKRVNAGLPIGHTIEKTGGVP